MATALVVARVEGRWDTCRADFRYLLVAAVLCLCVCKCLGSRDRREVLLDSLTGVVGSWLREAGKCAIKLLCTVDIVLGATAAPVVKAAAADSCTDCFSEEATRTLLAALFAPDVSVRLPMVEAPLRRTEEEVVAEATKTPCCCSLCKSSSSEDRDKRSREEQDSERKERQETLLVMGCFLIASSLVCLFVSELVLVERV